MKEYNRRFEDENIKRIDKKIEELKLSIEKILDAINPMDNSKVGLRDRIQALELKIKLILWVLAPIIAVIIKDFFTSFKK